MNIEDLIRIVKESENIVFFGGAGVSTESDIPDFRSESGIYSIENKYGYPPEFLLSHTFFKTHDDEFFKFYKETMIYPDAKPNKAHKALAILEDMGKLKAVITQNIDGLHQKSGSQNVIEIHGSVHKNYCIKCGQKYDLNYIIQSNGVPKCEKCSSLVRPDVVLYEEGLDMSVLNSAIEAIVKAEVLVVGGTSLNVYPAAGLVEYFRGKYLVLINKSQTQYDKRAQIVIRDSIGEVLDKVVRSI